MSKLLANLSSNLVDSRILEGRISYVIKAKVLIRVFRSFDSNLMVGFVFLVSLTESVRIAAANKEGYYWTKS